MVEEAPHEGLTVEAVPEEPAPVEEAPKAPEPPHVVEAPPPAAGHHPAHRASNPGSHPAGVHNPGKEVKHDSMKDKEKGWGRVTKADINTALATHDPSSTNKTFFTPGVGGPKWD